MLFEVFKITLHQQEKVYVLLTLSHISKCFGWSTAVLTPVILLALLISIFHKKVTQNSTMQSNTGNNFGIFQAVIKPCFCKENQKIILTTHA
jgi:hypothetical protein